ncbi:hypothetical protein [Pelagibius marinus]|uniref:hypothetical protein n=1 Tax=Pelagibius marinus TaxID=2762760 RepID=UPI001872D9C5|nr:hypothetical protein [Pelagibius marinus]
MLSRPFDPWKVAHSKKLSKFIDTLVSKIEVLESKDGSRANKRGKRKRADLCNLVQSLLIDLYVARLTSTRLCLGVNLNANWYTTNREWLPRTLTYNAFVTALKYLGGSHLGYLIEVAPGYYSQAKGSGENTKIRGTPKLAQSLEQDAGLRLCFIATAGEHNVVRLRDKDKQPKPFKETVQTKRFKSNLAKINRTLIRHWVDLDLTESQFRNLQARLIRGRRGKGWHDDADLPMDLSRRTLYRVFNQGHFSEGGRFYGGWWQGVPSELRPYLTINGKETVEQDYSAIQPAILYAEAKLPFPEDPYDIGLDPRHRPWVKRAFNTLVNAENNHIRTPTDYDAATVGMSYSELLKKVSSSLPEIAHAFGSGAGRRLQRIDSDIAEKVLLHFASKDIPCFPIHDSFVMHYGYSELEDVMKQAFEDTIGQPINVKLTELSLLQKMDMRAEYEKTGCSSKDGTLSNDFDTIMDGSRGPYASYNRRLDEWFAFKRGRIGT